MVWLICLYHMQKNIFLLACQMKNNIGISDLRNSRRILKIQLTFRVFFFLDTVDIHFFKGRGVLDQNTLDWSNVRVNDEVRNS